MLVRPAKGCRKIDTVVGMQIRAARASDQPAIETVVATAFGEGPDGRVVKMIRALNQTRATRISLIADDDGIVGHVQLSKAWIDARKRLVTALMLTPLAVVPERHRQGIGTRLVEEALKAAEQMGVTAVFLEGDPNYYGRRGFVSGASLEFVRPSLRIPGPGFQVSTLSRHEPWMTGYVIYPDAMWETDTVGLRDPQLAIIENALNS